MPAGNSCGASRKISRNSRLSRFRATALPNLRVTVIPRRAGPSSARAPEQDDEARQRDAGAALWTRKNSLRLRSRRDLGNDSATFAGVRTLTTHGRSARTRVYFL